VGLDKQAAPLSPILQFATTLISRRDTLNTVATAYYVFCANCGARIEVDRKPRGDNLATAFASTWAEPLDCQKCSTAHTYTSGDIRTETVSD
jgi:hypothetical protein